MGVHKKVSILFICGLLFKGACHDIYISGIPIQFWALFCYLRLYSWALKLFPRRLFQQSARMGMDLNLKKLANFFKF